MGTYRIPSSVPIVGWHGPYNPEPFERINERYQEKHYAKKPLNKEFLDHFSDHLFPILRKVKINHEYQTSDGRFWTAINVLFGNDEEYKLLFPRHENGRTSGNVTMYARSESPPIQKELVSIARAIVALLNEEVRDFYWNR